MLSDLFRAISLISENDVSRNKELWKLIFGQETIETGNDLNDIAGSMGAYVSEMRTSKGYEKIERLTDNANKKAKAAFLIQHPFQFYIYKNVYRHISGDSEFIIDARQIRKNASGWYDLLLQFGRFLRENNIFFRYYNDDRSDPDYSEIFFKNYTTLISNYATGPIRLACNKDKKKIRMMYGQSKDAYDFGPWLRYFDLALNYGPYSQNLSAPFVNGAAIGNPKFDDWFGDHLQMEIPAELRSKLDISKKTLLYLPTHGNLSSIDDIISRVPNLSANYNFIMKPHHLTLYSEPGRAPLLDEYRSGGAVLVSDFYDLMPLLKISDVVLLDNSGAIFDAVLAEKPIVILDMLDNEFFQKKQWDVSRRSTLSWNFPLTYADSIEQRIKRETNLSPGPVVKDLKELGDAIEHSIVAHKEKYSAPQINIKKMLFSGLDQFAGKRAAEAISNIHKNLGKKPFWGISVDIDMAREGVYHESKIRWLESNSKRYINLSPLEDISNPPIGSPIIWSIVVPTYGRAGFLVNCLDSLSTQVSVSERDFEILIIDDGTPGDEIKKIASDFINKHSRLQIRYIRLKKNFGAAVARNVGALLAEGEIVAYTDDDCTAPDNWLVSAKKIFDENPEIAGAGGWRVPAEDNGSIYAKFIFDLEMKWLPFSRKGIGFADSRAGDTASMFYKKKLLKKCGGFNKYFRLPTSPCLEDWELKSRIHQDKFSLFYSPDLIVKHFGHPGSLSGFIRYHLIRGWGYFLLSRLNPEYGYYDFTLMRVLSQIFIEFKSIARTKGNISRKLHYFFLAIIKDSSICFGRYWGAFSILYSRERI